MNSSIKTENTLKYNDYELKPIREKSFPQGLQLNWEIIYREQEKLVRSMDALKNIPDSEIRNDIRLVTDYDYTIILQQDNTSSEQNLSTKELFKYICELFDLSDQNVGKFGDAIIQKLPEIKKLLNRELNDVQQSQIVETQYCILNYFQQVVDAMIIHKFRKMHLISNSSFYLLFFGLFITADAIQLLREEEIMENPLITMQNLGYLEIESTNQVQSNVRKQFAFERIASNPEINHFISIGDGEDQEISSQKIKEKFPYLDVRILKFDFIEPNKCSLNILLSYHDECFEKLQQQSYHKLEYDSSSDSSNEQMDEENDWLNQKLFNNDQINAY